MSRTVSAIVFETAPLYRSGLETVLSGELKLTVLASTGSVPKALNAIRTAQPGLALVDLDALRPSAFDVIGSVRRLSPATRIVLLAAEFSALDLELADRSGVHACLLKTDEIGALSQAIRSAISGAWFPSKRLRALPQGRPQVNRSGEAEPRGLAALSMREVQVLGHLAEGHTVRQIAQTLCLSPKTVDSHRTSLMGKLRIHDRATLTRYAIRERLIPVWKSACGHGGSRRWPEPNEPDARQ